MATLLERRKHAIGNTFLNLQDEGAVSKFEALWRLPGSSRLRAHSVGAIIHADSAVVVKSPCANADDHGSPRFPCALWCDLRDGDHEEDDSQEVVLDRAQTAPTSILESFAGSRFDINPSPADTSGATDITPTGGGLSSRWDDGLEQESATLPRLLGRARVQPSGSKAPTVISLQEDMDQGLFKTRWVGADQNIGARGVDVRMSGEDLKELVVQKFTSPRSEVPSPQLLRPGNDAVHEANGLSLQLATQDAFESPAEDNEVFEGDLEVTTLMIRNVPTDITQKDLMNELDASGFKDLYDFLYMPCCFNTRAGKGFAFLNLMSVAAAAAFMTKWHKTRRFNMQGEDASLNIAPAACQGLEANIKKWDAPRMRRIRNPDLRPFVAGRRLLTKGDASLQDSEVVLEASRFCGDSRTLLPENSSSILPSNVHQDAGCDQAPISFIDASPGAPVYLNELARPGNDIMWSQTMPQCRMPNLVPQSGKASANHLASPMFDDYGDAFQAPPGLWTVGAACSRLQNQSEPGAVAPLPAGPLAPQASCPGAVAPLPAGPLAPQPSCPVTRAVFSTRPPCPPPQRPPGFLPLMPSSSDVGDSAPAPSGPPINRGPPPGNWTMVPKQVTPMSRDIPSSNMKHEQVHTFHF